MKPNTKFPIYITQDGLEELTSRRNSGDPSAIAAFEVFTFILYDKKEFKEDPVCWSL